ncbi:hypothetical protein [Rubrivirga sp.]|uniref:hypothetical protein n=1 Tax=Rubrivirga sp. TaxID=1885344 RepID=UPI003C77224C
MTRLACLSLLFLVGCDVNPFDESQQPSVRVQAGSPPVFSWVPQGARSVQVFRGANVTDALEGAQVWAVVATDGENGIQSPVTYGVIPEGGENNVSARALEAGQPYTVYVRRDDPRGTGDGFTNTNNEYSDAATFIAE